MIRGTVSSLWQDAFLGILHYQVAATPPETMQATVPDGAEHGVSVVHCVIIVVMSRNLVDPRSRGNTTRPSGWRHPNWTGSSRELSTRGPPAVVGCTDSSNASAEERRPSGGLPRWARSGIARPWRQPPQATLRARLVVCRASPTRGTWTLDHNPRACFGARGGSVLSAFFKRPARPCLRARRVRAKRTEERSVCHSGVTQRRLRNRMAPRSRRHPSECPWRTQRPSAPGVEFIHVRNFTASRTHSTKTSWKEPLRLSAVSALLRERGAATGEELLHVQGVGWPLSEAHRSTRCLMGVARRVLFSLYVTWSATERSTVFLRDCHVTAASQRTKNSGVRTGSGI